MGHQLASVINNCIIPLIPLSPSPSYPPIDTDNSYVLILNASPPPAVGVVEGPAAEEGRPDVKRHEVDGKVRHDDPSNDVENGIVVEDVSGLLLQKAPLTFNL